MKKPGSTALTAGKGGASTSGSEKGASAATVNATGGKTSARPQLISARGPTATDRPMTKLETTSAEETEKYEMRTMIHFTV
jgi:hypothetical protein